MSGAYGNRKRHVVRSWPCDWLKQGTCQKGERQDDEQETRATLDVVGTLCVGGRDCVVSTAHTAAAPTVRAAY